MSINKDRFRALPIKERAALINTYVSGGVMDLAEMKRHYNSFSDGGRILDGTETEQTTTSESPIKDVARDLAYKIITQKGVSDKGRATIGEIIEGVTNENPIIDDNKMMFLYGNVNGLPPASDDIGFDFTQYIQQNYPDRNIQSYQGKINPYNEYIFDEKNKGLIEELAKKGQHIYSNADDEYVQHIQLPHPDTRDNPTAEFMDVGYRDDVHSYPLKFDIDSDGNIVAHAADLYDFNAREYLKEFKPFKALQAHLLTSVGNPYILRQDNIPVKFIDLNGKSDYSPRVNYNGNVYDDDLTDEERRAVNFNWILKNISDEKVADYLDSGYIEPSVVESKKANGGRILDGKTEENQTIDNTPWWQQPISPLSPLGQAINDANTNFNYKYSEIPKEELKQQLSKKEAGLVTELIDKNGKAIFVPKGQAITPLEASIAEWLPGTGDVAEIGQITNDLDNNDYLSAAIGAGLLFLPGNVGKLWKKGKEALGLTKKASKATKVARDPNLVTDVINTIDDATLNPFATTEIPKEAFISKTNPLDELRQTMSVKNNEGFVSSVNKAVKEGAEREQQIIRHNEFARKYNSDEGYSSLAKYEEVPYTITDEELNAATKRMLKQHNTFYRGVYDSKEIQELMKEKGISLREALKISAHRPREYGLPIWVTPSPNVSVGYGGNNPLDFRGGVARLERPYVLGKDRTKWFEEADFDLGTRLTRDNSEIYNPWIDKPSNIVGNELLAKRMIFRGWLDDLHKPTSGYFGSRKREHGGKINRFEDGGNTNGGPTNNSNMNYNSHYLWNNGEEKPAEEALLTVPMYTALDGYTEAKAPKQEVEKLYGFHENVMPTELMPSTEELQNKLNNEVIYSIKKDNWKDHIEDDDRNSLLNIIRSDSRAFRFHLHDLTDKYKNSEPDTSEMISINAPNTDISKFIFGNKISKNSIDEIKRVAELRKQDPYDILSHMLIEGSGYPITTDTYYNTHDVIKKQVNPSLYESYDTEDNILKQLGIYNEKKTPSVNTIKKAYEKMKQKREDYKNNIQIPESTIDAVALRMLLHGRDFNPAQKGSTGIWTEGKVKNSYLDMIDSAIGSLKENMPDLFK